MPGLDLGERFYWEAVRPILDRHFPDLPHDAALIGGGSEIIGSDTPQSADHHWLPYAYLFVSAAGAARHGEAIAAFMAQELPVSFRGWPTSWRDAPGDPGTLLHDPVASGPVRHRVHVRHLPAWVRSTCGYDMDGPPTLADWLTIPEQVLLSLTAGRVFHAGLGDVTRLRRALAYYPHDVWLYLMSCQWQRIAQEEPFVGRAGDAGDDAGSAVIAARLARDVMRLAFLQARRYAPYAKHFAAHFARLDAAGALLPPLQSALRADHWQARERHLGAAYTLLAARHNALGLTDPLPTDLRNFHSRPFQIIDGERFADALWQQIADPAVRALPRGVGKVDQFSDNTDVLSHKERFRRLACLYGLDTD
jgi:hypothetical protein